MGTRYKDSKLLQIKEEYGIDPRQIRGFRQYSRKFRVEYYIRWQPEVSHKDYGKIDLVEIPVILPETERQRIDLRPARLATFMGMKIDPITVQYWSGKHWNDQEEVDGILALYYFRKIATLRDGFLPLKTNIDCLYRADTMVQDDQLWERIRKGRIGIMDVRIMDVHGSAMVNTDEVWIIPFSDKTGLMILNTESKAQFYNQLTRTKSRSDAAAVRKALRDIGVTKACRVSLQAYSMLMV